MKKIITILLLLSTIPTVCLGATAPDFVLTSKCITSIEVKEVKYTPGWVLIINLNESTANKMLNFSKRNIGKKLSIVNGKGENIIKNEIRIQSYISSQFQIAGLSTENDAIMAKKSLLDTNGECGERLY